MPPLRHLRQTLNRFSTTSWGKLHTASAASFAAMLSVPWSSELALTAEYSPIKFSGLKEAVSLLITGTGKGWNWTPISFLQFYWCGGFWSDWEKPEPEPEQEPMPGSSISEIPNYVRHLTPCKRFMRKLYVQMRVVSKLGTLRIFAIRWHLVSVGIQAYRVGLEMQKPVV